MDQIDRRHWCQLKCAATCVVYLLMSSFSCSWPHFSAYSKHAADPRKKHIFVHLFMGFPGKIIHANRSARVRQGNPTDSTIKACSLVRQGDSTDSTLVPELRILTICGVCMYSQRKQMRGIQERGESVCKSLNFVVPLSWCQHKVSYRLWTDCVEPE